MKPNMVSCIACTHALRRHDHSPAKTYLSVVLMLVRYFDDNCLVAHYKFNLLCLPVHCKHNSCFDEASLPLPLSLYPLVRIHLGSDHNCDSWQLSDWWLVILNVDGRFWTPQVCWARAQVVWKRTSSKKTLSKMMLQLLGVAHRDGIVVILTTFFLQLVRSFCLYTFSGPLCTCMTLGFSSFSFSKQLNVSFILCHMHFLFY